MQRWLILLLVPFGAIAGCPEPEPWVAPVPPAPVAASEPAFDRWEGGWTREGPFVCQENFACDQPAYCVDEQHYARVYERECCFDGPCSLGACAPDLPARMCPPGTVCRHLPSAELVTVACVDPAALAADAGQAPGPFAGNCGNGVPDDVEGCDDGNQISGDGCSHFCTLEPGWYCPGWAQPCHPALGTPPCPLDACRMGALCVDMIEPSASRRGMSCECPAEPLPECPPLAALAMPIPSGAGECWSHAVSADGTTIVGGCSYGSSVATTFVEPVRRAMRWTVAGGAEVYPGRESAVAHDVSADGSVVVGRSAEGPFIWTSSGIQQLDVRLGQGGSSRIDGGIIGAVFVSADGRVVAGGEGPAWLWTEAEGVRELQPATQGRRAGVSGITPDGSRIFGYEAEELVARPLIWNTNGPVEALPLIPDPESFIVASNADGSLLVINTEVEPPANGQEFIARVVLRTSAGSTTLEPDGGLARALSADGHVLLGWLRGGGPLLWRLDQNNLYEPLQLGLEARDLSGDGRVIAGWLELAPPQDIRRRAAIAWVP